MRIRYGKSIVRNVVDGFRTFEFEKQTRKEKEKRKQVRKVKKKREKNNKTKKKKEGK